MSYSNWFGAVLLIPSLLSDLFFTRVTRSWAILIIKFVLLFQGLGCWIMFKRYGVELPMQSSRLVSELQKIHGRLQYHYSVDPQLQNDLKEDAGFSAEKHAYNDDKTVPSPLEYPMQAYVPNSSYSLILSSLGDIGISTDPDIKYRTPKEVRNSLLRVFQELPPEGFDPRYRSPCWLYSPDVRNKYGKEFNSVKEDLFSPQEIHIGRPFVLDNGKMLSCLPLVYILGQPKCGTSDLYNRIARHSDIQAPKRKEVRR